MVKYVERIIITEEFEVAKKNIVLSNKPISAWGYVGYMLLYSIPVAGFIILIYHALRSNNINVRNYARSYFLQFLLVLIVYVAIFVLATAFGFFVDNVENQDGIQTFRSMVERFFA